MDKQTKVRKPLKGFLKIFGEIEDRCDSLLSVSQIMVLSVFSALIVLSVIVTVNHSNLFLITNFPFYVISIMALTAVSAMVISFVVWAYVAVSILSYRGKNRFLQGLVSMLKPIFVKEVVKDSSDKIIGAIEQYLADEKLDLQTMKMNINEIIEKQMKPEEKQAMSEAISDAYEKYSQVTESNTKRDVLIRKNEIVNQFLLHKMNEKDKTINEKDEIIKQQNAIIDDTSFKTNYQKKKLDKFQTKLDNF